MDKLVAEDEEKQEVKHYCVSFHAHAYVDATSEEEAWKKFKAMKIDDCAGLECDDMEEW